MRNLRYGFFQISKSSLFDLCGIVKINAMVAIFEISIYYKLGEIFQLIEIYKIFQVYEIYEIILVS